MPDPSSQMIGLSVYAPPAADTLKLSTRLLLAPAGMVRLMLVQSVTLIWKGDVTPLLAGFFDTAVGPKKAASSYERIATALDVASSSVLFISDVSAELDAARGAACQVALSVRPGNPPEDGRDRFDAIETFDEIT